MSRVLRGLGALVVIAALLIGVPLALARFVGRPWPQRLPSVDTIWSSIQAGDISDSTVIKALAVLIWIAWARLAVSILIEIAARIARSQPPTVLGLGSSQQWAAALIAAVVLMMGTAPRGAAAASSGSRPISIALLRADPVRPAMAAPPRYEFALDSAETTGPVARRAAMSATSTHSVQRHESFWSIAEDELGDGARWREIVDLNRGVEVAPGVIFDGTAGRLLPGWVLLVPATGLLATESPIAAGPIAAGPSGTVAATTSPPTLDASVAQQAMPSPGPLAGNAGQVVPALVPQPAAEVHTVRVESGDTLSEIAGEQLGDPAAWPQLWEANRGRDFNGRVFEDPNLIVTGWELVVPSESVATQPPPPYPPPPAAEVPARVPEALPSVDAAAPAVPGAPAPEPVPAATPQVVVSPATTAAVPTHNIPAPMIPSTAAPDGPPTLVTADATEESEAAMALPSGLGAAILLSGGVVTAVVSRRRRQMRGASVHARLADPSDQASATETVLRSLGEGEQIARLDIALRAAATELVVSAPGVAVLGAVVTHDGGLDLLLTGAVAEAPVPWVAVSEHRWRLAATVELDELAPASRRANQPCPAIAHIGSTPVGDGTVTGELFVDLETIGLLTIEGDSVQRSNVLRAVAAGVAMSPMSEIAHLIATGLPGVLLGHPSAGEADSLDIALDLAASAIGTTAATTSATLSTFTLRARHQGGEAWEPAIVFAAGAHHSAEQGGATDADLVSLTRPAGRGLAVVVDRCVDGATWRLTQQTHRWTLEPLGLELTPVGLTAVDLDHVRQLLDEADRPPLYDFELEQPAEADSFTTMPWTEPDWSLMVRVLGPVEVTDHDLNAVEFERTKALELVVWQSQHRDRSTRAAARTALWDLNVRDATFANVVSDARRALARLVPTIDNQEWIGRTLTEQLPLHRGVTTDAELLEARLAHARRQEASDAIATLRPGLELVRDAPFSGTSYLWPDAEGINSHLTLVVTSAATVLAGHYLAIGDTEGVFWATGQGLKVLAGHEELIALRMRAHARQGDLAGVRHEWGSYEKALNADPWSDGEPAQKLVVLRRQLLSSAMLVS